MNKQRILKEAQNIAAKYSFWMVAGNIEHLYGYVYETSDKKYELEIKFDENFPNFPPKFIYYDAIKELLGDFQLKKLKNWTPNSLVIDVVEELKDKIQKVLNKPILVEEKFEHISSTIEKGSQKIDLKDEASNEIINSSNSEEYITPDLNTYPYKNHLENDKISASQKAYIDESPGELEKIGINLSTELRLIQQYFSYDLKGSNPADINIYMTITISKTFIIGINFSNYPERPTIYFPEEVKNFLGSPNHALATLRNWKVKKNPHVIDILHELEKKLFFIKDIELESKKIYGEYQCESISNSATQLRVHLLTYGFKEYLLNVNLKPHPKPPELILTSELQNIIQAPISSLNAYQNWRENESEPVDIIREIAWLVDKNSRINFEIELLKEHYKEIKYDPLTKVIYINMKGKMKTQDLIFEFQINLPREYPMKIPEIKVLNKFELEAYKKIKADLQTSFKDFFNNWTPFSYLVDLFDLISKKIFEVSVVSCIICHKIECPTCGLKITGDDENSCHTKCPYCERVYHKHCWEQTIKSFGKCGFCLKTLPLNI